MHVTVFGYHLIMAANKNKSSTGDKASVFQSFPAVHEDENRAKYESRHAYDFSQFVKKKRKRGPKKAQETGASSRCPTLRDDALDEELNVLQARPIADSLLDVSDDDDQNMLDFDQPTTSGNVSAQVSPLFTYTTLLVNKNAVTFLDRSFLSFTLPDFDEVTNALHVCKLTVYM